MLLAVSEIVFEVIALGLEGVVIFVFNLPPCAPSGRDWFDAGVGDDMGCCPGIAVCFFTVLRGGDKLAPVDHQRIIAVAQGHLIHVAVSVGEPILAVPTGAHNRMHGAVANEIIDPFVEYLMGIGLARKNKIGFVLEDALAMRLVTIQVVAQISDAPCAVVRAPLFKPTR